MEHDGIVSLWLGVIETKECLDELLKISYTPDGDSIPSKFAQLFDIDYYEEDTSEAEFIDNRRASLTDLLRGFSYDNAIIPEFSKFTTEKELVDYNAIILLYNFEYHQTIKIVNEENTYFEFVGAIDYV